MSRSFTDLEVYQECRKFRLLVQKLCDEFPKDEKYKLIDQLIRSSRSVTANIAEGHGRFYFKDNVRFCRIARGSLEESLEHLIVAYDMKYINVEKLNEYKLKYETCMRLINGYIRYLLNNKKEEFE